MSVGEEQVVPIWGFDDLVPMARLMLTTLNEHRPGELTTLKGELYDFIERNEVRHEEADGHVAHPELASPRHTRERDPQGPGL